MHRDIVGHSNAFNAVEEYDAWDLHFETTFQTQWSMEDRNTGPHEILIAIGEARLM